MGCPGAGRAAARPRPHRARVSGAALQDDGNDLEGWQRLLRAYMVLGERDKALVAAGDARKALANDLEKLRQIGDLIKSMGLEG